MVNRDKGAMFHLMAACGETVFYKKRDSGRDVALCPNKWGRISHGEERMLHVAVLDTREGQALDSVHTPVMNLLAISSQ